MDLEIGLRRTSIESNWTTYEEIAEQLSESPPQFGNVVKYKCILSFEKNEATGLISVQFSYPLTDSDLDQSAKEEESEARDEEIRKKCIVEWKNQAMGRTVLEFVYEDPIETSERGVQLCEVVKEDDEKNERWQRVRFSYDPNKMIILGDSFYEREDNINGSGNGQKHRILFKQDAVFGWLPLQLVYQYWYESEADFETEEKDPLLEKLDEKRVAAWKTPQELYMVYNQIRDDGRMICKLEGDEDLHKVRVVAIGPYHHDRQDKDELFVTAKMKWQIVAYLQKRCDFDWKSYFADIKQSGEYFLSYYEIDKFEMDTDVFLEMLLLDGCFLLFALMILGGGGLTSKMLKASRSDSAEFSEFGDPMEREFVDLTIEKILRKAKEIKLDLIMYDNQIPFGVIQLVLHENIKNFIGCSIEKLALVFFDDIYPPVDPVYRKTRTREVFYHLLHLFHRSRTPSIRYRNTSLLPKLAGTLPSASELQESGIISFHKKRSGSGSAFDITFSHGLWGAFKLKRNMNVPKLHITDYMKYILHTLVIFEQHKRQNNTIFGLGVCTTSYLASMVQLVQSEKDVNPLRRRGILANTSKTDKEVLETIRALDLNRLSFETRPVLKIKLADDAYQLYEKVRDHQGRKWNIRYGEFKQSYCSNAWITLSVVAAILAFCFTGLQAVYSVMSYHFPKR